MRIKKANLPKLSQCHVCSEHFEKDCFERCCNLNLWPAENVNLRRLGSERRINKAFHEEVNKDIEN